MHCRSNRLYCKYILVSILCHHKTLESQTTKKDSSSIKKLIKENLNLYPPEIKCRGLELKEAPIIVYCVQRVTHLPNWQSFFCGLF